MIALARIERRFEAIRRAHVIKGGVVVTRESAGCKSIGLED
jgi:hypothetical protein